MRYLAIAVVVAALLGGILFFWIHEEKEGPLPELDYVWTYWPGQYPVLIADEMGMFREEGISVRLFDSNDDYNRSLRDVADGKYDATSFALWDAVGLVREGKDLVFLAVTDRSIAGEGVVGKSGLREPDLKGKRIGVDKGTYLEFILALFLEAHDLTLEDVELVDVQAERAIEEFAREDIDAVVTYEPYLSELREKNGAVALWMDHDFSNLVPSVLGFPRDIVDEQPDVVYRFLRGWFRAVGYLRTDREAALAIVARRTGRPVEEVEALMKVDHPLDLHENMVAMSFSPSPESLYGATGLIARFLKDPAIGHRTADFIDGRFVRQLNLSNEDF